MRFLMIAAATMLLMLPAIGSAKACGAGLHAANTTSVDFSAKKHKKMAKKPKERVEYMRAAPM